MSIIKIYKINQIYDKTNLDFETSIFIFVKTFLYIIDMKNNNYWTFQNDMLKMFGLQVWKRFPAGLIWVSCFVQLTVIVKPMMSS